MISANLCRLANLPEVHWKTTFAAIPDSNYKVKISNYCSNIVQVLAHGQGLYLWGPYSAGKSGLASLCVKAALEKQQLAYWVTSKELPNLIINQVKTPQGTSVEDVILTCPLLVIDEFQVRKEVKYTESLTEDIVRRRVDNKRSTIVTSNIVITDLQREYPAFFAVLQEALYPLHIHGHDFRKPLGGKTSNGLI